MTITTTQVECIRASAISFADSELGIKIAVSDVEGCIVPWAFEQYEIVRAAFELAYKTKVECTPATANSAWIRFASGFSNPKPVSTAAKAVKNAAARAVTDKAVKALITTHKSSTALRKAAAKALGAGQHDKAELLVRAGKTASREELAATVKALNPRWLAVGEKVSEAKKTADLRILEGLEKYLAVTVPVKALPRAKKATVAA